MIKLKGAIVTDVSYSDLAEIQVHGPSEQNASAPIAIICPHCGRHGTFAAAPRTMGYNVRRPQGGGLAGLVVGPRLCPNPECSRITFFVVRNSELLFTLPPRRIDFDASNIPAPVKECLEEAINCHAARADRAAALMVRRTLEELCLDRGAEGKDLKKRIAALGSKIVLPAELLDALDQLRMLGNDAAHVEARIYENIGPVEVEVGIQLAKEILKATYQYAGLVARLKGLGKSPA
jgi:hypothetical protein